MEGIVADCTPLCLNFLWRSPENRSSSCSQPNSRVQSSRSKHPTWVFGYIIRFPGTDKLILIQDGYRYRMQGLTLVVQICWHCSPFQHPVLRVRQVSSFVKLWCTRTLLSPRRGPGDFDSYALCLPFVLSYLAHFLLEIIHVLSLDMNFMVAPRISNIKHFIVQLMHTNYKILRLLK